MGTIPLNGCKCKGVEKFYKRLVVYHPKKEPLIFGLSEIEIMFASKLDTDTWKAVFLQRGQYIGDNILVDGVDLYGLSPEFVATIEKFYYFVDKYLNVVMNTLVNLSVKYSINILVYQEFLLEIDEDKKIYVEKQFFRYEMIKKSLDIVEQHITVHKPRPMAGIYVPPDAQISAMPKMYDDTDLEATKKHSKNLVSISEDESTRKSKAKSNRSKSSVFKKNK
ncbi:hypothetical protein RF11_01537 [Thelohanellus kitauei]|uniref:Uncharacterized protein n=1 Tax=Thelohanellus kitauei TaxID=669202 RepID=A0A0C2N500_THEKT|nr:hypothetical protein RF11_01537 [Thelohanellus kitauei]